MNLYEWLDALMTDSIDMMPPTTLVESSQWHSLTVDYSYEWLELANQNEMLNMTCIGALYKWHLDYEFDMSNWYCELIHLSANLINGLDQYDQQDLNRFMQSLKDTRAF